MYIKEQEEGRDNQSKIVTFLIVMLPFFRYYIPGLKPIMFSDIIQIYLVFLGIAAHNPSKSDHHVRVVNSLLVYGAYAVLLSVVSVFYMPVYDTSSNITTILRLWIHILIIYYTIDSFFDHQSGFQIALRVSLINSCLTFIQLILFLFFGIKTSLLIPFLDAEAGYSNERVLDSRLFRPTGLFFEPSQSLYFYVPVLFILLFSIFKSKSTDSGSKRKNFVYSVVLTIGLICTGSGAAAVLTIVFWLLFALYYIIESKDFRGLALLLIIVIAIVSLFRLEFFVTAFSRGSNLTKGSGSTRVLRGLLTWIQFPFEYKIFGIGYANYDVYVHFASFTTVYDYVQDVGLTNAAFTILSGLGIVGMTFLMVFFIRTFKCCKGDLPSTLVILYLFFSLFYSGIFLGNYFLIYMAYIFSRTNEQRNIVDISSHDSKYIL